MIYQVPCILEGETGTSKPLTASMMAKYRQWKIIEEEKKEGERTGKKKKNILNLNILNLVLIEKQKYQIYLGNIQEILNLLEVLK